MATIRLLTASSVQGTMHTGHVQDITTSVLPVEKWDTGRLGAIHQNILRMQRNIRQKQLKKAVHTHAEHEELYFDSIHANHEDGKDIMADVSVKLPGVDKIRTIHCKVDTGAQGNMLPLRTFTRMLPKFVDDNGLPVPCDVLQPRPYVELSAYNGTVIKHHV